MLERLVYFFRRALYNIRQSPFLCGAAIGTVAISLTILAFFAVVVLNVQKLTSHWSEEIQIIAYMDTAPPQSALKKWADTIRELPETEDIRYIDQNEAFRRFQNRLGADASLLDGLDETILPASFEITLKKKYRTRQGVESVLNRLRQNPNFSDLRFGQEWLERFESFVTLLQLTGAVLGGFLLFATLFIVSNTIRLTLYARRQELEIMALVGATRLFIKTPFLIEGTLQGLAGGLISLGGSFTLFHLFLKNALSDFLLTSGINGIIFLPLTYQILLVAAGAFLGFSGSLVSLRKFVRI